MTETISGCHRITVSVFLRYAGGMKNITVSVPDDVYQAARVRAAERATSVSALVAEFLRSISSRDAEFMRLEALQRQVQAGIVGFRGGDRIERAQIHERALR